MFTSRLALKLILIVATVGASASHAAAQAPKPATKPATRGAAVRRPAPPPPDPTPAERAELEAAAAKLGQEVEALRASLKDKPELLGLVPDVVIYHNALRYPVLYRDPVDMKKARAALAEGLSRANQLRDGKAGWTTKDGPRGYVSKIDGSVQPYYLLMPTDFKAEDKAPRRLDLFAHGRDERLTELNFLSSKVGNAPPAEPGKFVVLLYGRFCNANKFAGEVDCFEAIDDVARRHPVDRDRLVLTGFSMGGAAVWHLTVHHPDAWAATSPGAGFADTPVYQGMAAKGELDALPWYQRKLFHWYDCPDYALNLANVPCVAYAGELDKQILASEMMEKAAAAEGVKLERLVGPKTEHKYEPETRKELNRRLDAYAAKGRDAVPAKVRFATYTLRYNKCSWVRLDGLERHWSRARVEAEIKDGGIAARTENVTAVSFVFPRGRSPFSNLPVRVTIDGTQVTVPVSVAGPFIPESGQQQISLHRAGGEWAAGETPNEGVRKRPGLQGPIDDAFLRPFVIVRPTGKPLHAKTGAWADAECDRAIRDWRTVFRGEPVVVTDEVALRDDLEKDHNLVLFGDESSNGVIRHLVNVLDALPVDWVGEKLVINDNKTYPADSHMPVLVFPNPLNRGRYVVLNSGITFREGNKASNARQVAKLPDYAIVDVTEPPSVAGPGKVVRAGFFGERWELLPDDGR